MALEVWGTGPYQCGSALDIQSQAQLLFRALMARFTNFPNRFLLVFSLCDPCLPPSVARGMNVLLECYHDKADFCDGQECLPLFPSKAALTNVGNSC